MDIACLRIGKDNHWEFAYGVVNDPLPCDSGEPVALYMLSKNRPDDELVQRELSLHRPLDSLKPHRFDMFGAHRVQHGKRRAEHEDCASA